MWISATVPASAWRGELVKRSQQTHAELRTGAERPQDAPQTIGSSCSMAAAGSVDETMQCRCLRTIVALSEGCVLPGPPFL